MTGNQNKRSEQQGKPRNRKRNNKNNQAGNRNLPQAINNRLSFRNQPTIVTEHEGVSLQYSEVWSPLATGVSNYTFNPGKSGLVKLDQFAQQWQMYTLMHCFVRYQTSVGTTKDGRFLMGIDYDPADGPTDKQGVYALNPRTEGPVWESRRLAVSAKLAMTKKAMRCNSGDADNYAFLLSCFSDLAGSGEIFVDYRVHFYSPVAGAADVPKILSTAAVTGDSFAQPVGGVSVDKDTTTIATDATVTPAKELVHETTINGADAGDQFAITSAGPQSSFGGLVIGFKDVATGLDLVKEGYVVHKGNTAGFGIFTAIWAFVKPWLRPLALTAVDALLPSFTEGGDPSSEPAAIVVTDRPPSFVGIQQEAAPLGETAVIHRASEIVVTLDSTVMSWNRVGDSFRLTAHKALTNLSVAFGVNGANGPFANAFPGTIWSTKPMAGEDHGRLQVITVQPDQVIAEVPVTAQAIAYAVVLGSVRTDSAGASSSVAGLLEIRPGLWRPSIHVV